MKLYVWSVVEVVMVGVVSVPTTAPGPPPESALTVTLSFEPSAASLTCASRRSMAARMYPRAWEPVVNAWAWSSVESEPALPSV